MSTTIHLNVSDSATEELRQDSRTKLAASFNDAQSAWDAYREHLIEHGILPSPK